MKRHNNFQLPLIKIMTGTNPGHGWYVNKVTKTTYYCGWNDAERGEVKRGREVAFQTHNRIKDS